MLAALWNKMHKLTFSSCKIPIALIFFQNHSRIRIAPFLCCVLRELASASMFPSVPCQVASLHMRPMGSPEGSGEWKEVGSQFQIPICSSGLPTLEKILLLLKELLHHQHLRSGIDTHREHKWDSVTTILSAQQRLLPGKTTVASLQVIQHLIH